MISFLSQKGDRMGKYDKHICTTLEKIELQPGPTKEEKIMLANEGRRIMMDHVLWLDSDVLAGGYYGESAWIWPGSYPNQISQEELAKKVGVTRQTIIAIEKAKYSPSLELAFRIAYAFEVPLEEVFTFDPEDDPIK